MDNLDDLAYVERELNAAYLGFVVCRPLRGAEIGRTVLRTYPPDGARRFTVLRAPDVLRFVRCRSNDRLGANRERQATARSIDVAAGGPTSRADQKTGGRGRPPKRVATTPV